MIRSTWTQNFPPKPVFTEADITPGSFAGRVFIITGGNSGIGLELVKILYPSGATIYVAGRSQERVEEAIASVRSVDSSSKQPAMLKYLHLDLNDLSTIKASAADFASQEERLDLLFNNAGICGVPVGSSTAQGLEEHMGVNCVAPILFTQLLLPQLRNAVRTSPAGSVRIIWTGSLLIDTKSPSGGVEMAALGKPSTTDSIVDYAQSKAGNWYLAHECAERWGKGKDGIVSVVLNPGNLMTRAYRHESKLLMMFVKRILAEPKMGGYTMLYAGLSADVGLENNGAYVWPFGRVARNVREDIYKALDEGKGKQFWDWCEKTYQSYE